MAEAITIGTTIASAVAAASSTGLAIHQAVNKPDAPEPAPVPEPAKPEDQVDAESLAEQRRAINARRMGRQQLRIDPAIQASGQQTTGLFIPR